MVSECVWDVCDALARVSPLSELQNLQNSQKIKSLGANPLLCLSWAVGDKLLVLEIFHENFENFGIFCL